MTNFFVAITYKHIVVMSKQCEDHLTGAHLEDFVIKHFQTASIIYSGRKKDKLFLRDGDPCQNSAPEGKAMKEIGTAMFLILPRSPDINPIENFFHLIDKKLSGSIIVNGCSRNT